MSIREFSKNWDPRQNPKITLEKPHEDNRGMILPLVDETMRSAVLITSKKGTVRANHYHHTDWHYCYVLKGSIDYYYRPAKTEEKPEVVRITKGEMFFTPPQVDHAMVFVEDTDFVCFGKNPRDQASYESDITRIELFKSK
jgi:quercetin dioxygenase-like cupin family protein